ncbi:hypothetical protein [Yoonia vestfoldensis]|uniref:hypothetical protein n=1 Tax=Yoonia vestfoldensis TaxID=245188 RepID=UPI000371F353|nr:hypothetical protein [Yoonia vestfoldensis]
MSHSEDNMDRQVKRHKGPLVGFIAIIAFVAVLLVWWLGGEVEQAQDTTAPGDGTATSAPVTGPTTDTADDGVATVPAQNPAAESADEPTAPVVAD